jgi:hypothetical protein
VRPELPARELAATHRLRYRDDYQAWAFRWGTSRMVAIFISARYLPITVQRNGATERLVRRHGHDTLLFQVGLARGAAAPTGIAPHRRAPELSGAARPRRR